MLYSKQKVDYADNNTLVLGYGSCVVQKRSPDKHAGGSNKRIKSNEDTFVSPLTEALSLAVRHGQCESVLWMQNTVELYPTSSDCDWASRNGHLSLLVFMMTNDYGIDVEPPCPSIRSLDWAVLNSHMDVVQYLLTLPPRSVPNQNICSSASSPALPRPTMFTRAQALNFAERYGLDNVTNMLNSLPETTVEPNVHRDHSNTTTSSSFHSSTEPSKSTVRLLSPSSVSLLSPGTVPMDSK